MNRKILRLALPSIITNITVPLLGMVDTAIVGHLDVGSSRLDYIGGIAVGTMIFNFIYWNFGFLRLGTSGFTAQAYGARNLKESMNILTRALSIAIIISLILIILQYPISLLTKLLIENNNGVWDLAMRYFSILIWAAPATLGMYALKGWFIGMQDAKSPMWISIFINVLNIVFSLIFVLYFGMKIEGVAWGTLIAQYGGLITTITIWLLKYSKLKKYINIKESLQWEEMKLFFKINSDIFLRTLCLVLVTTYFTIASSKFDYPTLAVNALLMQLFTIFSYFMDGFAYTAESLAGRYYGAKDRVNLKKVVKYLIGWGLGISVFFMIGYTFFGQNILRLLTNKEDIILASRDSFYWTLIIPLTGFLAFLYDGILIGLTASSIMRNVMFIASATFFIVYFSLSGILGNSALWLGFILYLSIRSFLSWYFSKKLIFSK
ncbi:MAG: family efflux transporter [Bacteroidetes bacterium]|nr:family efflux transporter [Bacteroidota bacterium]